MPHVASAANGLPLTEDTFRGLLETAPYALVIVHTSGRIAVVNAQTEALFGYRREELIGQPVEVLIPPRFRDTHGEKRDRYFADPKLRPMGAGLELFAVRKDGTEFPVEISLSPLTLDAGLVVTAAVLDRTERKRAEEERRQLEVQLLQAQKMESLGILTGGIAHDFNNLLTVILGNTSLAQMQLPPESPAHPAIREIETAAVRSSDLVKQMLAYAGKGRFVVQPLSLSKVIEEIAHLLQTVISKKAVLRFEFAPDLPAVNADATQVRQVVMNLITNASDAVGDKSGVIALRTGVMFADRKYLTTTHIPADLPDGYYAYIEVADTGCGMDPATLDKIFDPFFTTKFTGRGLGLAAVLGIVRGHKGAVKIYSELKRGTTFKVLFPCSDLPAVPAAAGAGDEAGWRGSGTILVVDDEEHVRGTAKRILEFLGFSVTLAADGREALAIFRQNPAAIRAALVDLTMPHMGGDELFREMRLVRPDARVVLMSGYNEQEVSNLFAGKGLAGFVQKPFRADDLLAAFRQALDA
jgi:two-component system cell cycle sensor histidine kinase/response regulator CckA